MSDFGGLTRYHDANLTLPLLKRGEQRIIFLGDSITDQWNLSTSFPNKPAYLNRGISGQVSAQMLIRFKQDVIDVGATAVVILAGINDIGAMQGYTTDEEVQDNLTMMSELAVSYGIMPILSSITPTRGTRLQTHPMIRITTLNVWIRSYARTYIDYFSAMLDTGGVLQASLTYDDLHPNETGYAIMAPLAEAAIQRTLGEG